MIITQLNRVNNFVKIDMVKSKLFPDYVTLRADNLRILHLGTNEK